VGDLIEQLPALAQFHDEVHGSGSEEDLPQLDDVGVVNFLCVWVCEGGVGWGSGKTCGDRKEEGSRKRGDRQREKETERDMDGKRTQREGDGEEAEIFRSQEKGITDLHNGNLQMQLPQIVGVDPTHPNDLEEGEGGREKRWGRYEEEGWGWMGSEDGKWEMKVAGRSGGKEEKEVDEKDWSEERE
jgi:hypothetical protein